MTAYVSAYLVTEVLDLSSISLYEIRMTGMSLVDEAVAELADRVRNGECVESVQGQRD